MAENSDVIASPVEELEDIGPDLNVSDVEAHVLRYALSDYIEHESEVAYDYRSQGDFAAVDELDANVTTARALLDRLGPER